MSPRAWHIRAFRKEDQESIKQIYRETVAANPLLYYRPLSGPQLPDNISENFSHPNDAFYVAESEGAIIGFCGLRTMAEDRSVGTFVNGTVIKEFQGQGVYRELFRVREKEAIAKGLKTFLAITSHHNLRMKEHLLRDGFEEYEPSIPVPGFYHLRKFISFTL